MVVHLSHDAYGPIRICCFPLLTVSAILAGGGDGGDGAPHVASCDPNCMVEEKALVRHTPSVSDTVHTQKSVGQSVAVCNKIIISCTGNQRCTAVAEGFECWVIEKSQQKPYRAQIYPLLCHDAQGQHNAEVARHQHPCTCRMHARRRRFCYLVRWY